MIQALLLTTVAGLSTTLGALISYLIKKPKLEYLSILTGFAAGVMIYVSFVELLGNSIIEIGFFRSNASFFIGIVFIYLIDKIIPHFHMDTEPDSFHEEKIEKDLTEAGVLVAIGIALHNFPEGMAVFLVSLDSISLGLPIALAIAIHNIPEGIAVSSPIFYATGSRKKAFLYSFLSGVTEPIGALVGLIFLFPFLNTTIINLTLSFVAGIMIFISFDELLPVSRKYGDEHLPTIGLFLGMFIMMLSLSVL